MDKQESCSIGRTKESPTDSEIGALDTVALPRRHSILEPHHRRQFLHFIHLGINPQQQQQQRRRRPYGIRAQWQERTTTTQVVRWTEQRSARLLWRKQTPISVCHANAVPVDNEGSALLVPAGTETDTLRPMMNRNENGSLNKDRNRSRHRFLF